MEHVHSANSRVRRQACCTRRPRKKMKPQRKGSREGFGNQRRGVTTSVHVTLSLVTPCATRYCWADASLGCESVTEVCKDCISNPSRRGFSRLARNTDLMDVFLSRLVAAGDIRFTIAPESGVSDGVLVRAYAAALGNRGYSRHIQVQTPGSW